MPYYNDNQYLVHRAHVSLWKSIFKMLQWLPVIYDPVQAEIERA